MESQQNTNTQIQKLSETGIAQLLHPKQADLIKMIGELQLKKETSFALQAVLSNDYLAKASPASVAKAIWNVAITGLTLNPIHKLAYITPRSVGGNVEAILMPSYQGLVKLITDTGSVKNVYAYPVYEGDEFTVTLGMDLTISHNPKYFSKKLTHVYAVAILLDGSKQIEVMSANDVNEIRDRSDGYKSFKAGRAKSAIWETDYSEMARKTVVKRICKYLPKSDKMEALNEAIEIDNEDYSASEGQCAYIERLITNSAYDHEQKHYLEQELSHGITRGRADKLIADLQLNQLDPVTQGGNYSQTDIQRKIAEQTA